MSQRTRPEILDRDFQRFAAALNEVGDGLRRAALNVGFLAVRLGAVRSDTYVHETAAHLAPFKVQDCSRN